jgi:UDP-glucose 4-epimerase
LIGINILTGLNAKEYSNIDYKLIIEGNQAKAQTGWETKRDLAQMMEDSWRWVSNNPNSYDD